MANLTNLVKTLAEELDLDAATVREQARVLRDAGLMAKQKAGRNGGTISTRDAVNLLLAVAGTSRPSRSCHPVEGHGACISKSAPWRLQSIELPQVKKLPDDHSLADLLQALVKSGIACDVDIETGGIGAVRSDAHKDLLSVEVVMSEPLVWTQVRIGLAGRDADGSPIQSNEETRHYGQNIGRDGRFQPPFDVLPLSDLSHQHRFTQKILLVLAKAIKE